MKSLAGSFLVAKPVLRDPNFRETVVLLLQHGSTGALGLVVNRTVEAEGLSFPLFCGGPCPSPGLMMLHGHAEWVTSPADLPKRQVTPGVFLGDEASAHRAIDPPADQGSRYRMFTGYASWAPGQLEGEIAAGAWATVPATADVLFDTPIEDLWTQLLPPIIPQPSVN